MLDDYVSDYCDLLKEPDVPGIKIMAMGFLAIQVYIYTPVLMASTPNISMTYLPLKSVNMTCEMILLWTETKFEGLTTV